MKKLSFIKAIVLIVLITQANAFAQMGWWSSSDTVNVFNRNSGSVMIGSYAPLGKLTIGSYDQFYNLALIGDYSNLGKNYFQIGVAGRAFDRIQGQTLFDLTHSNAQARYAGFNFRINGKSYLYINGEGNTGIGTEKPEARLDLFGGPSWGPYNKALHIPANHAVHFESGSHQFGLVPQNNELSIMYTSNTTPNPFGASFTKLMAIQPGRVVFEGDIEVRGQILSKGQIYNGGGNGNGGGSGGGPAVYAAAPGEAAGGADGWLGGNTSGSIYYSQGPVGIGTSSPSLISGSSGSFLDIGHVNNPGLALSNKTSGGRQFFLYSANNGGVGSFRIYDATGSTDRFIIHQNGNVGIGTVNPSSRFEVAGSNTNPLISANVLSGYGSFGLQSNGSNKLLLGYNGSAGNYGTQTSAGDVSIQAFSNLHFVADTDPTTHPTRLFVGTSGNVGIGTVTPAYKLDVAGTINATQLLVNGAPLTAGNQWTTSGSNLYFNTGNVGIGNTSPTAKLHIASNNNIAIQITNALSTNLTSTQWGSNTEVQIGSGLTGSYVVGSMSAATTTGNGSTITHARGVVGSAWTAGTNNTYTNAYGLQSYVQNNINSGSGNTIINGYGLYISDVQANNQYGVYQEGTNDHNYFAGTLGIGVTTPNAAYKLDVAGAVRSSSGGFVFPDGSIQMTAAVTPQANSWSMYAPNIANCSTAVIIGSVTNNVAGKVNTDNHQLVVNGSMTTKKVVVTQQGWADFVFEPEYRLRPLSEVENHIKAFKHLPEIPSAKEIESSGIDLGEVQAKLLQKIEELTLYMIDQNKRIEALQNELHTLKEKNKQ